MTVTAIAAICFIMILVPVVPSKAAAFAGPSNVPPLNVWVLRDPSGTYSGSYLGNGTYSMNLTTYQELLRDPYTGVYTTGAEVQGNSVIITVPQSDTVSGPTSGVTAISAVQPSRLFESVTYWLLGHGGFYANGHYRLV